jgi:hypothetical protein
MTDPTSKYSSAMQAFFEPCAVYNSLTNKYVLWFVHPYLKGVATSDSPRGPFEMVSWHPDGFVRDHGRTSSDFYLWQTASGELFMKHNAYPKDGLEYVSQVSDDYLSIVNTSAALPRAGSSFTEGGGIFQYRDQWYVMTGYGCCFCGMGSNGFYWMAEHPLGPWTFIADVIPRNADGSAVTRAQQFSVAALRTTSGIQPMFIGIRFGSSPDKKKVHDFQYWAPMKFDGTPTQHLLPMEWTDSWEVSLDQSPFSPTPPPAPPAPAPAPASSVLLQVDVFVGGPPEQNGTATATGAWYDCFRLPSAVHLPTAGLFVFAESRANGSLFSGTWCADQGPTDITMRRSTDHGRSFGPVVVVVGPRTRSSQKPHLPTESFTARNPYAVVAPGGGILLSWTNTTDPHNCVNYQMRSEDGMSWGPSVQVVFTDHPPAPPFVPPLRGGLLMGPGTAIVLGRHSASQFEGRIVGCGAIVAMCLLQQCHFLPCVFVSDFSLFTVLLLQLWRHSICLSGTTVLEDLDQR